MPRTDFARALQGALGISDDFAEASDHPYTCTCAKCRAWWQSMGPDDETGMCGPWTVEELEED